MIAIIIGHDRNSTGAYSKYLKSSEYNYNQEVARHLSNVADIYRRPLLKGYKHQMEALAKDVNSKNYDLVVELHFNSFNGKAKGCETVGFVGNDHTKSIGEKYCDIISNHYQTTNRGHKTSDSDGRGYWFLKLMKAPALIVEPFFGDNIEAKKFEDPKEYACVIKDWLLNIEL